MKVVAAVAVPPLAVKNRDALLMEHIQSREADHQLYGFTRSERF